MSGYTDMAVVESGHLNAEAAFLPKPFGPETLLNKVREVLEVGATRPVLLSEDHSRVG
jgi:hypothetical protein